MDSQAYYSAGEVAWLLSIEDPDVVRAMDEGMRCPLGALSETTLSGGGSTDDGSVFAIARWNDVRAARERVLRANSDLQLLELKLNGQSERDIAQTVGVSQPTVHRRARAALAEILEELGGEAPDELERLSLVPACMQCGKRPRTRVPEVRRRVRGEGMVVVRAERQSSLCEACLAAAIARQLQAAMNQNGRDVQRYE